MLRLEVVGRELDRCGDFSLDSCLSFTFRVMVALFFIVAIASFRQRIDLEVKELISPNVPTEIKMLNLFNKESLSGVFTSLIV